MDHQAVASKKKVEVPEDSSINTHIDTFIEMSSRSPLVEFRSFVAGQSLQSLGRMRHRSSRAPTCFMNQNGVVVEPAGEIEEDSWFSGLASRIQASMGVEPACDSALMVDSSEEYLSTALTGYQQSRDAWLGAPWLLTWEFSTLRISPNIAVNHLRSLSPLCRTRM